MSVLIHSDDVFKETELISNSDGLFHCSPLKDNIGSLPTLFTKEGDFNHEAN
nr:site-specific integrase [Vibrio anguillarum]